MYVSLLPTILTNLKVFCLFYFLLYFLFFNLFSFLSLYIFLYLLNFVFCFLFFIFLYKIELLLYLNLSIYVCEAPSWILELRPLPPTSHEHLYLWSNHYTKGARWLKFSFVKCTQII